MLVHHFRSDVTVVWLEMVSEAWLIVMIGFPDHALDSGVVSIVMPVFVVVDVELSLRVFNESVGIVDT